MIMARKHSRSKDNFQPFVSDCTFEMLVLGKMGLWPDEKLPSGLLLYAAILERLYYLVVAVYRLVGLLSLQT